MSLIVENGSGVADAESYASVAQASAYHAARGSTAWNGITDKEAALRKAADFMTQTYRLAWKGYRVNPVQALDWPRYECYVTGLSKNSSDYLIPSNTVPLEVQNACMELALRTATEELNPDLTQQILSSRVGPLSITYSETSPQYKRFRAIDMMLCHLLSGNGITAKVGRS